MNGISIYIPQEIAQILRSDTIHIDGQKVDRLLFLLCGHQVQVNCFDGDKSAVLVWVDGSKRPQEMAMSQVVSFIQGL